MWCHRKVPASASVSSPAVATGCGAGPDTNKDEQKRWELWTTKRSACHTFINVVEGFATRPLRGDGSMQSIQLLPHLFWLHVTEQSFKKDVGKSPCLQFYLDGATTTKL